MIAMRDRLVPRARGNQSSFDHLWSASVTVPISRRSASQFEAPLDQLQPRVESVAELLALGEVVPLHHDGVEFVVVRRCQVLPAVVRHIHAEWESSDNSSPQVIGSENATTSQRIRRENFGHEVYSPTHVTTS
jgi:hypothetical protein